MNRKKWILIAGALVIVLSFLFSDGVRHTFSRRRAIHEAEAELERLNQEADQTRENINQLQTNPKASEHLVRKELGYLRPGEKELRFIDKK